jgi:Raf kinase inhibitor-like YbhB/YbcL family protein
MQDRTFPALLLTLAIAAALPGCATPEPELAPRTGMALVSPGRADNSLLPALYGGRNPANPNCAGSNVSPALAWTRVPPTTRSLAILMDDQAGRVGLGVSHWVAYGIAPELGGLAEGEGSAPSPKLVGGKNLLASGEYFGPCPPRGNAPQHYVFTLIATTLEPGALPPGLSKAELLEALKGKTIAAASTVLRYAH